MRTTTVKRDLFYGRFTSRRQEALMQLITHFDAKLGLAVNEVMVAGSEIVLVVPLTAAFGIFRRCAPGTITPVDQDSLALNVFVNYATEIAADTSVQFLGPEKPFIEALARTQNFRVTTVTALATIPQGLTLISILTNGVRFGVKPDGGCVAVHVLEREPQPVQR